MSRPRNLKVWILMLFIRISWRIKFTGRKQVVILIYLQMLWRSSIPRNSLSLVSIIISNTKTWFFLMLLELTRKWPMTRFQLFLIIWGKKSACLPYLNNFLHKKRKFQRNASFFLRTCHFATHVQHNFVLFSEENETISIIVIIFLHGLRCTEEAKPWVTSTERKQPINE